MEKTQLKASKRFWMLLKPDQREIRNVYVYAIFSGLIGLSLPVGIQSIINLIQGAQISTSWFVLIIFVILGILINGILQIRQLKITENLQQKIFARAAFDFAYRVPRFKLNALIDKTAPELMNRFFDVMSIQKGLSKVIIDFSTAGIQTLFGLILLSIYHPFFIIFSLFLVILIYAVFAITGKKGMRTSLDESKNKYAIALWLQEIGRSRVAFKMTNNNNLTLSVLNEKADKYIFARESHFEVLVRQFKFLIGFKIIVAAGLLIIGSLLVMDQQMNIGQFVAAEIIILLVIGSVEKMILSLEVIYDILTSLEKVGYVTDVPLDEEVTHNFRSQMDGPVSIKMTKVSFDYSDEDSKILDQANCEIAPGQKVHIHGNNCSGKKTLLTLLAGLQKVSSGTISINDVPINNYNVDFLHANIGLLTDEDCIFNGTIYDNIVLGRENISTEDLKWAVKLVGLKTHIETAPNGFNEYLFAGNKMSASIRCKILLARTLVAKPPLLLIQDRFNILDEVDRNEILTCLFSKDLKSTLVFTSNNTACQQLADLKLALTNQELTIIK